MKRGLRWLLFTAAEFPAAWRETPEHRRNGPNILSRVEAAQEGRVLMRQQGIDPWGGEERPWWDSTPRDDWGRGW